MEVVPQEHDVSIIVQEAEVEQEATLEQVVVVVIQVMFSGQPPDNLQHMEVAVVPPDLTVVLMLEVAEVLVSKVHQVIIVLLMAVNMILTIILIL